LNEFLSLLGVSAKTIESDIEGLEHHLSDESFKGIEKLITVWPTDFKKEKINPPKRQS